MTRKNVLIPVDNTGMDTQGETYKEPEIQNKGEPEADQAATGQVKAPG